MSKAADDLLKKALSLGVEDRASLAGALIESLDRQIDPDAEGAWEAEILRRVSELESRAVETVPWTAVRERLFNGFE